MSSSMPAVRAWSARAGTLTTWAILALLGASLVAQLARDRCLALALLMYVPLGACALAAVAWDLALGGRALGRRWLLLGLGLIAAAGATALLWSPARAPEGHAAQPSLRLLHWNVQWGGARGPASFAEMIDTIDAPMPDVLCLSEAPDPAVIAHALPGFQVAHVQHDGTHPYWYRLAVVSRDPVRVRAEWSLAAGHAALFEVAARTRAVRILMVDLESSPMRPRSATLREVARILEARAAVGEGVDLVAGDFNTPARFLGFDALGAAGAGYRRTALWSGQWRGTWPSQLVLPPFDIDHVWVRRGLSVAEAALVDGEATDHRAQRVLVRW